MIKAVFWWVKRHAKVVFWELLYVCFRRFQPTPQLSQENASPCAKKCLKVPSIMTISNILIFAHQQNLRTLSRESLISLTTFLFSVSFHSETLETRVSYLTTKQNRISPENGAFQTKIVFWNKLNSDWTLLEEFSRLGFTFERGVLDTHARL